MDKEIILELVRGHYNLSKSPLLLSEFGKILRERGLWPPVGKKQTLLECLLGFTPELEVDEDPETPAYKFVVLPEFRDEIDEALELREELAFLKTVPKSFILAFGISAKGKSNVFVQTVPPFRYRIASSQPSSEFAPVEERFRVPDLDLTNLDQLPPHQLLALVDGIDNWLEEAGFDRDTFAVFSNKPKQERIIQAPRTVLPLGASMLERLKAAQPEGIADQMVIPLDIALHLSKQYL